MFTCKISGNTCLAIGRYEYFEAGWQAADCLVRFLNQQKAWQKNGIDCRT